MSIKELKIKLNFLKGSDACLERNLQGHETIVNLMLFQLIIIHQNESVRNKIKRTTLEIKKTIGPWQDVLDLHRLVVVVLYRMRISMA